MRRRLTVKAAELMPHHLVVFDAPRWGWDGPHYEDGYLVDGWHEAELRWHAARREWMAEHPEFDWLADIIGRVPDAPWLVA